MANQIEQMDPVRFFTRFPEAARLLAYLPEGPEVGALRTFELHRRHAHAVTGVVDAAFARLGPRLRRREFPPTCLLHLVAERGPEAAPDICEAAPAAETFPNAAEYAPAGPAYFMRRVARGWWIRFNGQQAQWYPNDIGIEYLAVLFSHPGVVYTAAQLACIIRARRSCIPSDHRSAAEALAADTMGADR